MPDTRSICWPLLLLGLPLIGLSTAAEPVRGGVPPGVGSLRQHQIPESVRAARGVRLRREVLRQPLNFEANQGQTSAEVRFLARARTGTLFLTEQGAVLAPGKNRSPVRMQLSGARPATSPIGEQPLPGKVHYLVGRDPGRWRRNVATYARVRCKQVYPGVDVVYHGSQGQLEYDFVIEPGGDPGQIRLDFHGVRSARIDAHGDLLLTTPDGTLRQPRPALYQDADGTRRTVQGGYVLSEVTPRFPQARARTAAYVRPEADSGASRVFRIAFQVGSFDPRMPLVIDPLLVYSTLLGGSLFDSAQGVAVDGANNAYIAGATSSRDFPGAGFRSSQVPTTDTPYAFVAKFNPEGTQLLYASILGGLNQGLFGDIARGIAVDPDGNCWIGGQTDSRDFPTTTNALQAAYPGGGPPGQPIEGFLTKLSADGSQLLYSSYFGGSGGGGGVGGTAAVLAVATGLGGRVYITGQTDARDIPETPTVNEGIPILNPVQRTARGGADAFVASFDPNGLLLYSTYLGGSNFDRGLAITVGVTGVAYVTGQTFSTAIPGDPNSEAFPTTPGALQTNYQGNGDGFVTTVASLGGLYFYSTYLGGSGSDNEVFGVNFPSAGIAVDGSGEVYVTGTTLSDDFPTTTGALQVIHPGAHDAYVTKIRPDARLPRESQLKYSTYLGGGRGHAVDLGKAITVDSTGIAYVTGYSDSLDFPLVNTLPDGGIPPGTAYLALLNPTGTGLLLSTRLGADGVGEGRGVALGLFGDVFVAGDTTPTGDPWPTSADAFQRVFRGNYEAFLMRIRPSASTPPVVSQTSVSPASLPATGGNALLRATATAAIGVRAVRARITSPIGEQQIVDLVRVSGTANNGVWELQFAVPPNNEARQKMFQVQFLAVDMLGTASALTTALTFTVAAGEPDRTAPTISGAKVTPATLARAGGPVQLQLAARDARGVTLVQAEVAKPDGSRETILLQLVSGNALNGQYRTTFAIPANGSGRPQRYTFVLSAGDAAGNQRRVTKQVTVRR